MHERRRVLVIVGSARAHGVSARYAREAVVPEAKSVGSDVRMWNVADHPVEGCIACERCRGSFRCFRRDAMDGLFEELASCDAVEVIAPVFFSGPTAQFKAVLDRFQPLWERRIGPAGGTDPAEVKRPVRLHVIGSGGDPHGFDPLATIVRSAFGSAGFRLVDVIDAVGWGQADAGIPDMDPCAGDAAVVAPCARDRSSRMKGIVS